MSIHENLRLLRIRRENRSEDSEKLWDPPSAQAKIAIARKFRQPLKSRRFAVVIVHYQRFDETSELLQSIMHWDEKPELIVIADNSPSTYNWSFTAESPIPVSVRHFDHNPGYGSAINSIVKSLGSDIPQFLVLTHETLLAGDCSRLLLDSLHGVPRATVSAPILLLKHDPHRIFSLGGELSNNGIVRHVGAGNSIDDSSTQLNAQTAVDWADGACLMVRRDVFGLLNGMDVNYFLYVEELDFQFRARLAGGITVVNAHARAWQSPGNYPLCLKYTNHIYFTRKMRPYLDRWPWEKEILKDLLRWIPRRITKMISARRLSNG